MAVYRHSRIAPALRNIGSRRGIGKAFDGYSAQNLRFRPGTEASQLAQAAFQQLAFGRLFGERECAFIGGAGVRRPSKAAQEVCAGGMSEAVVRQRTRCQDIVNQQQTGLRAVVHRNSHSAVEADDGGGVGPDQQIVKRNNAAPVGFA